MGGLFILLVGIEMCSDDLDPYSEGGVPVWESDPALLNDDFTPPAPPLVGSLGPGQVDRHQVYLVEGLGYVLTGSCSEACLDLDLSLSWMGQEISSDYRISTSPSIQVVPQWPGYYDLDVEMVECGAPSCGYEVYTYF